MLPFPQLVIYGNIAPVFSGTFSSSTYSPIFTVRQETGYCSDPGGENHYVFGGVNAATFYKDLWHYKYSTDTWEQLTSFPPSNRSSPALCYNGDLNMLYSFGGSTAQPSIPNQKNDLYQYDLSTNTWTLITPTTSLPPARLHANMQYYNNKLYLFGGYEVSDTWVFDLSSLSWTQLSSAPYVKSYGSSTVLIGSDMYAIGYTSTSSSSPRYLMKYDILTDTWNIVNSTTYPLGRIVQYNSLLIAFGYDDATLYRSDMNSDWVSVSTQTGYAIDNNVFISTPGFLLTLYGKNSSGSALNQIYKIT